MPTCCIIIAGSSKWRLAVVAPDGTRYVDIPLKENAAPDEIAAAIDAAMTSAGASGARALLAVPSIWCLSASIETGDLPKHDRLAMLYRLEEKLPVAAEAMAADFVEHEGAALGVCVQLERVKPLIDALESRYVVVQSACPFALLAAQYQEIDNGVLLQDEPGSNQISVLTISGGVVLSWALTPANPAAVIRHLSFLSLNDGTPSRVVAIGLNDSLLQELQKQSTIDILPEDVVASACEQARRVLAGEVSPWIELRRGPMALGDRLRLHRGPLNMLLASVMVLILAISGALLWRSVRYARADAVARQHLDDAFREHFPGWEVPENVRVIVESEHRKALAAGAAPGRSTRSATQTLVDVLNRLPSGDRFTIDSMSFADHSFELQGKVRSLDALDPLLSSARATGMTISAPEAHKMPGGTWSFAIRGASEQPTPIAKGDQ